MAKKVTEKFKLMISGRCS